MSFFLLLVFFALFAFLLSKWRWIRRTHIKKPILLALFGLKAMLGFGLVFLYGSYYNPSTSDIYIYYNDAVYLKQLLFSDANAFWNVIFEHNMSSPYMASKIEPLKYWSSGGVDFIIHEKKVVILINLLLSFISFNNIYIHSLFFAFVGFVGQIALYKFIRRQTEVNRVLVLFVAFLLPTLVIWSSSILKEPLILFSVGYVLYYVGRWTKKWKIKYLLPISLFLLMGLLIKPYVIISLAVPLLVFILFKWKADLRFKTQSWMAFSSLLLVFFAVIALSYTRLNPIVKLSQKQADFYKNIELSETEVSSQIDIPKLEPKVSSLMLNVLPAFTNVMFKPHIYEYKKALYIADIIQNLLLLSIALSLVFGYRVPNVKERPIIWLSVLFVIILFTLIGLVTPVLGAVVRYKIIALPFLFIFLFSFLKQKNTYVIVDKMIFKDKKERLFFIIDNCRISYTFFTLRHLLSNIKGVFIQLIIKFKKVTASEQNLKNDFFFD